MVQSTGTKKIKCAVFISGTGSNLKSLIQFAKKKNSPISIELIISDNPKAKGLKFGKIFKISNKVFNYKNKIIAEKKIISEIKNKKIKQHELLMKTSIFLSLVFLVMYILYHMTTDPTPYGGEGFIRYLYFFILITHITLSVFIVPMVLITYVRAISKMFDKHKKIARITYPIWLYIAVSGVVVYLMISPYYIH